MRARVQESADYILRNFGGGAETALILGSGLNYFAESLTDGQTIDYAAIPHFPRSTAPGHYGRLRRGRLGDKQVIVLQGRFHLYEGHPVEAIAHVIRTLKLLGVARAVFTNAAGGINREFKPGELMLISDHINLTGHNPLAGHNDDFFGPRFPDMSTAYSPRLRGLMRQAAQGISLMLREGVYAGVIGPSFETPAEIRMMRAIGADAVGMSTVLEVIAAVHCGMEAVGVSCVSNMAAGILDQPITVEEVMQVAEEIKGDFSALLRAFVDLL